VSAGIGSFGMRHPFGNCRCHDRGMELSEVIRRRRMVRSYDPDRQVPDAVVDRLLDHAVRAPSAGFSQGWDFLVLRQPAHRQAFWDSTTDPDTPPDRWLQRVSSAPLLIVCLSD